MYFRFSDWDFCDWGNIPFIDRFYGKKNLTARSNPQMVTYRTMPLPIPFYTIPVKYKYTIKNNKDSFASQSLSNLQ